MSTDESPPGDLADLATSLKQLRPAAPGIERDRLLFEAGQRSARRPLGWQAATFLAALVALGTALGWHWSSPEVRERIVYLPAPTPQAPTLAAREEPPEEAPPLPYRELGSEMQRGGVPAAAPEFDLSPTPVIQVGSYADPLLRVSPFSRQEVRP